MLVQMLDPAKKRPRSGLDEQYPLPTGLADNIAQIRIGQKLAPGRIGKNGAAIRRSAIDENDLCHKSFHGALNERRQGDRQFGFLIPAFNDNANHARCFSELSRLAPADVQARRTSMLTLLFLLCSISPDRKIVMQCMRFLKPGTGLTENGHDNDC